MIVVIGTFRFPAPIRKETLAAIKRVIAASRNEAGCIAYAYAEDVLEPGLFRVNEAWESREALTRHFQAPHMQQWREVRAALGMTDREVEAYAADGAEVL